MYRMQYGVTGDHPNCHDNLSSALREHGVQPEPLTSRAEMDLVVAVTACPASTCNGAAAPKPIAYEITG
jgi:uncharacterized protein